MGVLAGGSGYFQLILRLRLVGPLHAEVGALGIALNGMAGNASAGLVVEVVQIQGSRLGLRPYLAAGVGAGGACGEDSDGSSCVTTTFVSGRAGLAIVLLARDPSRREVMLTLDGGVWHGRFHDEGEPSHAFTWPMIGVGVLVSL